MCCVNKPQDNPFHLNLKTISPGKSWKRNDVISVGMACAEGHYDTEGSIRRHGIITECVEDDEDDGSVVRYIHRKSGLLV